MTPRGPSEEGQIRRAEDRELDRDKPVRQALEVDSLFSIDFEAERRKVLGAALADPSDILSELALAARSRGANQLWIRCSKGTVAIRDDGARLPSAVVAELAVLMDGAADARARHGALAKLEESHCRGCLAMAWHAREGSLTISTADQRVGERLVITAGGEVLLRPLAPPLAPGSTIELAMQPPAYGAAVARLIERAKFSPLQISIDDEPMRREPHAWLLKSDLREPFIGRAALQTESQTRVTILEYGVVCAQLGLSGAPDLELVVEVGGHAGPRAGPGDLRQLVQTHASALVGAAVVEFVRRAGQPRTLSLRQCSRLSRLLAQAQRHDPRLTALRDVAVLPLRTPESIEFISLRDLERVVDAAPGRQIDVIDAADAGAPGTDDASADLRALVLESADRAAVAASVQASFSLRRSASAGRLSRGGWRRALLEHLLSPASWLAGRLAATVREGEYSHDERRLVDALRLECGEQVRIVLIQGRRAPFRVGSRLYLARDHALVSACARAHAAGSLPAYVALRALGSEPLTSAARKRARDRFGDPLLSRME